MRFRDRVGLVFRLGALCLMVVLAAGCRGDPGARPGDSLSPTASTTHQEKPPSGRLVAELRQYSHDVARNNVLVWIDNGTDSDVLPTSITYHDPRFPAPIAAENMRSIPAGSYRGFAVPLPARPQCGGRRSGAGRAVMRHEGGVARLRTSDPHQVVEHFLESRCAGLALAEVAELRWLTDIPADEPGRGSTGTLTLLVTPTGTSGREVVIQRIHETHLLGSGGDADAWEPRTRVAGGDPPTRIELPLRPARCDEHAFLEGGNATAFRIAFTVDGEPGEVRLRMGTKAAGAAIDFALASCGYDVQ